MKSPGFSEFFRANRTGYLVPRILRGVTFVHPRGFSACAFPNRSHVWFILSQASAFSRDPYKSHPCTSPRSELRWVAPGSSHEVSHPFSAQSSMSRHIVCFHTNASPYGLFQTLEGLILTEPHSLVSYCTHSWDSYSPGLSPHTNSAEFIIRQYPPGVSAVFRRTQPASPGPCISCGSVSACGVLHPQATRYPLEFSTVSTVFLPPPWSPYF
jgi:hypothetical protein